MLLAACSQPEQHSLVTIADARAHPPSVIDNGKAGDSPGDILVFDQPLLDEKMKIIGTNSGSCIRTKVAHSFQCQWVLSMDKGSIVVAGRELDQGTSTLGIVGGAGIYAGIYGDMESTNNNDGTFTQVLRYRLRQ
ncbi:MAG TPA: hypothetical protein ENJ11_07875 [Gammaproteobacteria bacterium]|nr:hypothetical protein [Gammaproteobacteria bacterium]